MNRKITVYFVYAGILPAIFYLSYIAPEWIYFLSIIATLLVLIHWSLQVRAKQKRPKIDLEIVHHTYIGEQPMVSIHMPISNEPPELVIGSLKCCLSQAYQNFEVIILDNNTTDIHLWKPVEEFCEDHDCLKFVRYPSLEGFKAGALHKCMLLTGRKTIYTLVIDADYCLKTDALSQAVRRAQRENLDLLQFPQAYRNINSGNEALAMDYQHYFDIYATAANTEKVMLSTGTLSLFRLESLRELPGWDACNSITEDAEIGLQFLKANFKTSYCPMILGYGLMPLHARDVCKQRTRWMFGNMQTLIKNRWKLFSGKDLTIIAQLTAWINFLFPAYLGLFLILVFGIHNFNLSELQIALWLGCVPFLLYILGKFILLYGKPFTISDLIKTLGVHLYLNFQSSFVWIPSLLGIKKPFCKTPKQEHTQRKRMLTCTSFIFILFFAMASIALYFQMLTLSLVYTSLGMIYGASTYFTLNMFRTSPELEKLNLQTHI